MPQSPADTSRTQMTVGVFVGVGVAVAVGDAVAIGVHVQVCVGVGLAVADDVAVLVQVGVGWASAGDRIVRENTKRSARNPRKAVPIIIRTMTLLPYSHM